MKSYKNWKRKTPGTSTLLKKIQESIRTIVPDADIILYGSRVRGEAGKYSDWDILILVDQIVDNDLTEEIRDSLYEVELETDEILSCIIRSKRDWNSPRYSVLPFKRNIEQEGILL